MGTNIDKAITTLVIDQPFFGVLAMRMRFVKDPSVPTMATDGTSIFYNDTWSSALPAEQLKGVIAHEVLHVALGHPWRRDNRDPTAWNVACDHEANHLLDIAKFTLPKGCLNGIDKPAELIYRGNPAPPPSKGKGEGKGKPGAPEEHPGRIGDVIDSPGGEADKAKAQAEALSATVQAVMAQKAHDQGTLPGAIARIIGAAKQAPQDWRTLLREFVGSSRAKDDYNWSRPNRRHIAKGMYLPSLDSPSTGNIVVVVDTSGSIGESTLSAFGKEINGILEDARPESLTVIYADAAIQKVQVCEPGNTVTLEPEGGGGTDFRPAFESVDNGDRLPDCLIYLTDMYGPFPCNAPEYPVLWVSTSAGKVAPFGQTIEIRE